MSNVIGAVLLIVLVFLLFGIVFAVFLWAAAHENRFLTIVKENMIKFKFEGGNLADVLLTSRTHLVVHSRRTGRFRIKPRFWSADMPLEDKLGPDDIISQSDGLQGWLEKKWGIYWLGWLPVYTILEFQIRKEKLLSSAEAPPDSGLAGRIKDNGLHTVDHLRRIIQRPFHIKNINTRENYRSGVLCLVIFEVIDPTTPVIDLTGDFFLAIESLLSQIYGSYLRDKFFTDWRGEDKAIGTEFYKFMIKMGHGLVGIAGVRIKSISIEDIELSEEDQEAEKALQGVDIAKLKGQAALATARYKRKADEHGAKGAAAYTREQTAALSNVPAHVVSATRDMRVADALAGEKSSVTTLVGGNGGALTAISLPPPPQQDRSSTQGDPPPDGPRGSDRSPNRPDRNPDRPNPPQPREPRGETPGGSGHAPNRPKPPHSSH